MEETKIEPTGEFQQLFLLRRTTVRIKMVAYIKISFLETAVRCTHGETTSPVRLCLTASLLSGFDPSVIQFRLPVYSKLCPEDNPETHGNTGAEFDFTLQSELLLAPAERHRGKQSVVKHPSVKVDQK